MLANWLYFSKMAQVYCVGRLWDPKMVTSDRRLFRVLAGSELTLTTTKTVNREIIFLETRIYSCYTTLFYTCVIDFAERTLAEDLFITRYY